MAWHKRLAPGVCHERARDMLTVRVYFKGRMFCGRSFTIAKHGFDRALALCVEASREMHYTLGKAWPDGDKPHQSHKRSQLPLGVSFGHVVQTNGRPIPCYHASFCRDGEEKHKRFSANKYGRLRAKRLAIAQRLRWEREECQA